jgi:hypothetical protein
MDEFCCLQSAGRRRRDDDDDTGIIMPTECDENCRNMDESVQLLAESDS